MTHYTEDMGYEAAHSEAARIMSAAGIVGRVSDQYGAVTPPDTKDGKPWPHIALQVSYSLVESPNVERFSESFRVGIGHVPRKLWEAAAKGALLKRRTDRDCEVAHLYLSCKSLKDQIFLSELACRIAVAARLELASPSDVLATYAGEALEASETTFEDWAGNFGYDSDSRKAERMYNNCRDILPRLLRILSREDVERLAELSRMF